MRPLSLLKIGGAIVVATFTLEFIALELIAHDPNGTKLSGAVGIMMTLPPFLLILGIGVAFLLASISVAVWRSFDEEEIYYPQDSDAHKG